MKPTQAELRAIFDYEPEAGSLLRKPTPFKIGRGRRLQASTAGHLRKDGYVHVQVGARSYYAHCIIWCWVTGEWPENEVDHRDLNRANNIWLNLREATPSQNCAARGEYTPERGVELLPSGKYRVRVRSVHIGCFDRLEDAAQAYQRSATERFGEFAACNRGAA